MKKVLIRLSLAGFVALALSACGGGGGGSAVPSNPSVANESLPRIEPFDPTVVAPRALMKLAASAGVVAQDVVLGAPEAGFGAVAPAVAGAPRQIGQARPVAPLADVAGMRSHLRWQPTASGGKAAAARIRSTGAASVRLALWVRELPASATVRVFANQSAVNEIAGAELLSTLARNASGIGASISLGRLSSGGAAGSGGANAAICGCCGSTVLGASRSERRRTTPACIGCRRSKATRRRWRSSCRQASTRQPCKWPPRACCTSG